MMKSKFHYDGETLLTWDESHYPYIPDVGDYVEIKEEKYLIIEKSYDLTNYTVHIILDEA